MKENTAEKMMGEDLSREEIFKLYPRVEELFRDDAYWIEDPETGEMCTIRVNMQGLVGRKDDGEINPKSTMSSILRISNEIPGKLGRKIEDSGNHARKVFLSEEEVLKVVNGLHVWGIDGGREAVYGLSKTLGYEGQKLNSFAYEGKTKKEIVKEIESLGVGMTSDDLKVPEYPTDSLITADDMGGGNVGDDLVKTYLEEISKVPLLSSEEEFSLAIRIGNTRKIKELLPGLDRDVSENLAKKIDEWIGLGELARDHMIRANMRLVVSIAKKFRKRGVPFLDLIQEGSLGLMKAVNKYDLERGFRFSTYATWWIRQTISRAIGDFGRTIRLPIHMGDEVNKFLKKITELKQKLEREPSDEEMANFLDIDMARVELLKKLSTDAIYLEEPVGEGEDSVLGDFVPDGNVFQPEELRIGEELKEEIARVLMELAPREQRILELRLGLNGERNHTLEEVGGKFALTRERIRQIEAKALRRLRHPKSARRLREHL